MSKIQRLDDLLEGEGFSLAILYHQRGALEHTLFGPFRRLVLGCINADFCVQWLIFQHFSNSTLFPSHHSRFLWFFKPSHRFSANFRIFCGFSKKTAEFWKCHQNSTDFSRNFAEFCKFATDDAKIAGFQRNMIKFVENLLKICRKFAAKFLKISEKMYALNRSGGDISRRVSWTYRKTFFSSD